MNVYVGLLTSIIICSHFFFTNTLTVHVCVCVSVCMLNMCFVYCLFCQHLTLTNHTNIHSVRLVVCLWTTFAERAPTKQDIPTIYSDGAAPIPHFHLSEKWMRYRTDVAAKAKLSIDRCVGIRNTFVGVVETKVSSVMFLSNHSAISVIDYYLTKFTSEILKWSPSS